MAKTDTSARPDIRFFTGSTGSGKSYQMKLAAKDAPRLLVFDPDDEYTRCTRFTSTAELAKAAPRDLRTPFRATFVARGPAAFDAFCRVAWYLQDARAPLTVVVDELAGVDRTAKADGWWHSLVSRGRKYRTTILAGAQSGAEISKTLLRQRSYLWIGYLTETPDHVYLEERTRVPREVLAGLRGEPHYDAVVLERGESPVLVKRGRRTKLTLK